MKKFILFGVLYGLFAAFFMSSFSSCLFEEEGEDKIKGKSCLFVSTSDEPGNPKDLPVINKLRSWNLKVTVLADSNLPTPEDANFATYYQQFDFAFLSESPGSMSFLPLKSCPLPILNMEPWAVAKPSLFWSKHKKAVQNYAVMPSRVLPSAPKALKGGLDPAKDFKLVTGTSDTSQYKVGVIGFIPTIKHIPIAVLTPDTLVRNMVDVLKRADSSALGIGLMPCAAAVEKGTLLSNDTTITQNRSVTIGIHSLAYDHLTTQAWDLIRSGVNWILD